MYNIKSLKCLNRENAQLFKMAEVGNIGHNSEAINISLEYMNYRQSLIARVSKRYQYESTMFTLMRQAWNEK